MQVVTTPGSREGVRVERVVTSGDFALDGGTWEVENNIWILGDDEQCVVIDAAHDASPILEAVGGRSVTAIVLTHGHNDHINASKALQEATGAPRLLHSADRMLWDQEFPNDAPEGELVAGETMAVAGVELRIVHTPGHSPGGCCLHAPELGVVFSGDTLFNGGPGATGRSFSDFPTIIESISGELLTLPSETLVLTGHGDTTTIGSEAPQRQEWIDRGH